MIDRERLLKRIADVRAESSRSALAGPRQSTITILTLIYGPDSPQLLGFIEEWKPQNPRGALGSRTHQERVRSLLESVLDAAEADLEAGITTSNAVLAKGEVLGDFVALAREALARSDEGADSVAAVLAAASFEDVLKQLAENHGLDVDRREIRGTIEVLKRGGVLVGARAATAEGYVEFRNAALHGRFDGVDRATTLSLLAFVQELLLEAFS